jgi:hypothetical protein
MLLCKDGGVDNDPYRFSSQTTLSRRDELLEVDYFAWNEAIAAHFFNPAIANRPIFLHFNDEVLNDLGIGFGFSPDESLYSYVQAVRRRSFQPHKDTFEWFSVASIQWKMRYRFPPFIGLLAMLVLAASHMSSSNQKFSSANYYSHLADLLGQEINQREMGLVDQYWEELNRWLEAQHGQLGLPTARRHPHFTHVGYPLSQILLRKADLECLPGFFMWAGFTPEIIPQKPILFSKFQEWMTRTTCTLDSHLYQLTSSEFFDETLKNYIAEVLQRELARWDKPELSYEQYCSDRAFAALWLYNESGSWMPRLIAQIPEYFPKDGWQDSFSGLFLEGESGSEWIGCELTSNSLRHLLCNKVVFQNSEHNILASFAPIVVFKPDPLLSGWTSCTRVELGTELILLFQSDFDSQIFAYLMQFAAPDWKVENLSEGLTLCSRVYLRFSPAILEAQIPSEDLRPRIIANIRLKGGLKLNQRTWLKGFEPTALLEIPGGLDHLPIQVDGVTVLDKADGFAELDLRNLDLESGVHTLSILGIREKEFCIARQISTLSELARPEVGGFSISANGIFYGENDNDFHLDGSFLRMPGESSMVVCSPGFQSYTLIGENPGEFLIIMPPVSSVFNPDRPILATMPFIAQWVVNVGKKKKRYLHLVGKPTLSKDRRTKKSTEPWKRAIAHSFENLRRGKRHPSNFIQRLWKEYCEEHE